MATATALRMSIPLDLGLVSSSSMPSRQTILHIFLSDRRLCGEKSPLQAVTTASGSLQISKTKIDRGLDLGLLLSHFSNWVSHLVKFIAKQRLRRVNLQLAMEKCIMDCRFFSLLAIGGSLMSSVICFVEGCLLTMESYLHSFQAASQISEKSHFLMTLIEAIDMFLLGTAMLTFGIALHVMFMGPQTQRVSSHKLQEETDVEAKSRVGHAVLMILQVQLLEKFKMVPVTTGFDLALVAGALFLSSASLFVLCRMTSAVDPKKRKLMG